MAAAFLFLVGLILQGMLLRWIFSIDAIVTNLEKITLNLDEIKKQNSVLINQQDELIALLEEEQSIYQQSNPNQQFGRDIEGE